MTTPIPATSSIKAAAGQRGCSAALIYKRLGMHSIPGAVKVDGRWLIPRAWVYKPGKRGAPKGNKNALGRKRHGKK